MSAQKTPYELIGGADKVNTLVDRFYDLMALEDLFADLRVMHPSDLTISREKLKLFLIGWMGGPDVYSPKYGHPMLRARHLPFKIGLKERNLWLACMYRAIEDCGIEGEFATRLEESLFNTADWMRNQPS
ncbi:MAG: group II truncated hemoglobin [Polynucleobacter sp.]